MTAGHWGRVKELFDRLQAAPRAERERLLAESVDTALAGEVRALLDAHDASTGFLEQPALAAGAAELAETIPAPLAGERIGAFRLTHLIGEGGMGVVYEGVRADGAFEQRVAIKILKRWTIGHADISRFRNERQILAGLDHPNIARLLDGGTTSDGVPYYAMEFVAGEYIDDYCRARNLGVAERLELFLKVCDAVEYAHGRGVIHRDLKPANILVNSAGAPKLLDFGIAKLQQEGAAATRTLTINRAATPYYASPEQLNGEAVTAATDVYSLGVLLYELLAESHPYRTTSDSLHAVAKAICEQDPEPPSRRAAKAAWGKDLDHVVLQAMAKPVAERYASAAELGAEIRRYLEHRPVLARRRGRANARKWRWVAVAAAIAGAGAWWTWSGTSPARPARRSLAVIGFQNLSGNAEAAWMGTALSEMLSTDLASSERVRVVSADTVTRVRSDLNLTDPTADRADVLDRLRSNLGVDYFVTGSFLASGEAAKPSVRLYIRLQDARSRQIVAGVSETGTSDELPSLVTEGVTELLRNREWSSVARARTAKALAPYANVAAAKLYAGGLDRLRHFDAAGARDLLRKAVEADPANPLPHSAYSESLRALGYDEMARAEAKSAYDLSSNLPREQRLLVTARHHETASHWSEAIAAWRTLRDLFFDNPEYGLRLAGAQISAGKPNDAAATLAALRAAEGENAADPRIDLEIAEAAGLQSDYRKKLDAAVRACDTATRLNARQLAAEAYLKKGDALYGLSRNDEALDAYRASEQIHRSLGNTYGIGNVVLREGRLFWVKGDYAACREHTERALALFEQIGNRSAVPSALNNLALATRGQGDMAGALAIFDRAIAVGRELGATSALAGALNNSGNILRRLNRQEEARRRFEECLAIAVELNDQEQVARSHLTLSAIDFDDGNIVSTLEHIRQALALEVPAKNPRMRAVILQHLGDARLAQGDTSGARQAYEESVAISRPMKAEQYVADGAITLAEIALRERNHAGAARQLAEARDYYARQKQKLGLWDCAVLDARIRTAAGDAAPVDKEVEEAAQGFHASKAAARELDAWSALAEVSLRRGQAARAHEAIQRGRQAFEEAHEFQARMRYRLMAAKVAASHDRVRARTELHALVAELESKSWSALAAEARQALGELGR